jgi:hypothetical protein
MSSNEVVRQHFVPRTYLKHFGFSEKGANKIYCASRDEQDPTKTRLVSVANICLQNGLYTLDATTSQERMALEDFYRISTEDKYDALRAQLLDEKLVIVEAGLRQQVLHTVATMLTRTTKMLSQHNVVIDHVLEQMYALCKASGKDSFDFSGEIISIKDKSLQDLQKEFRTRTREGAVLTQLDLALRLVENRGDDLGLLVLQIDEQAGEFITSDHPVIVRGLEGQPTAFYKGASLQMPIGPKHMLWLMSGVVPEVKNVIFRWNFTEERAKIERIISNIFQQENAERWILGSRTELERHIYERTTLAKDNRPTMDIEQRVKELGLI